MKDNFMRQNPEYAASDVDTLIISDVHLGSKVSRAKEVYRFLESYRIDKYRFRIKRLILLGDIFDDLNFNKLDRHAWKLAGLFRAMASQKCDTEIVWILGNHDLMLADLMHHLVGLPVCREYEWECNGRRFLAAHGDQFDKWIVDYYWVSVVPTWFYSFVQTIDGSKHRFSRFLKETSKKWLRINKDVADKFVEYARSKPVRVDNIFCGHTHISEIIEYPDDGMTYYNTGCWTGSHNPTYVAIDSDGQVMLREYAANPSEATARSYPRPVHA